ncbi:hypothetical protein [Bosea sp. 117]|uniref:hypothetical protein n=1 Tax=Bosea sp. 117 TaxID=1125973 RepID=UPI00068C562C|nr:hypothetical protein [Bosea sp. 117]
MMQQRLEAAESLVNEGTCVISADYGSILAAVKDAVESGRSATFYVSAETARRINEWYWTPERKKELRVEDISPEEKARIEKELGLRDALVFSNRTPCEKCGNIYGAFEFLQQGLQEHGRSTVEAVMAMRNVALIRVNPTEVAVCPNCSEKITRGGKLVEGRIVGGTEVPHYYGGTRAYAGCCRGGQLM